MCLAILALGAHPDWPVVIAANRDEFHGRAALAAAPWQDAPHIIAGKDVQGGGTWLGTAHGGRFALLTNVREPGRQLANAPSRGSLVEGFLRGSLSAAAYASEVQATANAFNGFNLLIGDSRGFWYCSNRAEGTELPLASTVVGLSNAGLDTPWPKLTRSRDAVATELAGGKPLDHESLFAILGDRSRPADSLLPNTGVGLEVERMLGSPFIQSEVYGTRCSTVVAQHVTGRIEFRERRYLPSGAVDGDSFWELGAAAR